MTLDSADFAIYSELDLLGVGDLTPHWRPVS